MQKEKEPKKKKDAFLILRIPASLKASLSASAKKAGQNLSTFVRAIIDSA